VRLIQRRGRSCGQALAEFAIAFPIFALILFGIVDLGRYVFTANQLGNAARDAARAGSVMNWPPDCSAFTPTTQREQCVVAVATNRAQGILLKTPIPADDIACRRYGRVDGNGDGEYDSSIVASGQANNAGQCKTNDVLIVTIKHEFTLITPLVSQFVGVRTITGDAKVTVNN
jgi:hypothetical protein